MTEQQQQYDEYKRFVDDIKQKNFTKICDLIQVNGYDYYYELFQNSSNQKYTPLSYIAELLKEGKEEQDEKELNTIDEKELNTNTIEYYRFITLFTISGADALIELSLEQIETSSVLLKVALQMKKCYDDRKLSKNVNCNSN